MTKQLRVVDLESVRRPIHALCERLNVSRLDLFGSMATDSGTNDSDVDVLVTFSGGSAGLFDRYFILKEELETILQRNVDVVTAESIRNPYFRTSVYANRINVYLQSDSEASSFGAAEEAG